MDRCVASMLVALRRELYRARNENEIDDEVLEDALTLLDALALVLRTRVQKRLDAVEQTCREPGDTPL